MATVQGDRIRLARKLRRLTQTKLAELVGVKQVSISQMEMGLLQPSPETLDALSIALGFPPAFLQRTAGPEFPLGSLLFRARRASTRTDLEEAHSWAELLYECASGLAARVERIPVAVPILSDETPVRAAQMTRSALGLSPDRPISNLTYSLERGGVFILAVPVQLTGRDAFSTWAGAHPAIPVIFVSTGVTGDRLRFSISHELGHLVLHSFYRGYVKDVEAAADIFAGEFLAPAAGLDDELPSPISFASLAPLKLRWGVAIQALIMRAKELGHISERRTQQLFQGMTASGFRLREPAEFDIAVEKPRAFRKMAEMVYGEPLDPRKLATAFDLPMPIARGILSVHAERTELVSTVQEHSVATNVIRFRSKAP